MASVGLELLLQSLHVLSWARKRDGDVQLNGVIARGSNSLHAHGQILAVELIEFSLGLSGEKEHENKVIHHFRTMRSSEAIV